MNIHNTNLVILACYSRALEKGIYYRTPKKIAWMNSGAPESKQLMPIPLSKIRSTVMNEGQAVFQKIMDNHLNPV
jgi:hypothetical protein